MVRDWVTFGPDFSFLGTSFQLFLLERSGIKFTIPVFHEDQKISPENYGIQIIAPGNDRIVRLSRF